MVGATVEVLSGAGDPGAFEVRGERATWASGPGGASDPLDGAPGPPAADGPLLPAGDEPPLSIGEPLPAADALTTGEPPPAAIGVPTASSTRRGNPYAPGPVAPADSTSRSSAPSSLRTYTAASATPANARNRSLAAASGPGGRGGPETDARASP
ncbi:hypothetical protein ABZ499_16405 [Streptomyces sp. NPDC019990]|uniref:hypothetical protein n=1 Tax=Streptomyces sp. NPDC019990 TaxID=3154693 RepID=UPI0033FABC65